MSSLSRRARAAAAVACVAAALCASLASCDREDRRFRESPPAGSPSGVVRLSPLQPGPELIDVRFTNPYESNAYAVSQGQRLFAWYNCVGCHANGGGGMGPPLMDDEWLYGSAPEQVYSTIMEGRPNGMPSWAGRIPETQVWQIVAYVRSLSALTPAAVRSARPDHMMSQPGSLTLENPAKPRGPNMAKPVQRKDSLGSPRERP